MTSRGTSSTPLTPTGGTVVEGKCVEEAGCRQADSRRCSTVPDTALEVLNPIPPDIARGGLRSIGEQRGEPPAVILGVAGTILP